LVLISAIAVLIALFFLRVEVLLVLFPPALLSLFYALPMFGSGKGLRDLPYLKVFLIAFSWGYLTVPVTAVELGVRMDPSGWSLFIERTLFVFAITVPFDIRDLPYDDPEERTFPQVLGVKGAKGLAVGALSAFLIMTLIRLRTEGDQAVMMLGYSITAGVAGLLILGSEEGRKDLYYEGLLDGTMVLMPLLLLLFEAVL
jgi:4-hydroxybenzoate polyprenyltransferase